MTAISQFFSHSVGQKAVMGLTGLFLVSFLLVHLSGNLQLFLSDGGLAFNTYSKFMTTNPVIRVMEWVLFAGFIVHIVYAVLLTRANRKARPVGYAFNSPGGSSSWFSRNMGLSGSIVFIFLAVHLYMFWGVYHFGSGEPVSAESAYQLVFKLTADVQGPDGTRIAKAGDYLDEGSYQALQSAGISEVRAVSMYDIAKNSFKVWWITAFYVLAMVLLAFHLNHGFQSSFRTLGLVHPKYTPLLTRLGTAIAVIFPLVFAAMPVYLLLT